MMHRARRHSRLPCRCPRSLHLRLPWPLTPLSPPRPAAKVESRPVPLLESMGRRMTSALTFGGSPMNLFGGSPQAPATPNITGGNKRTSAFF